MNRSMTRTMIRRAALASALAMLLAAPHAWAADGDGDVPGEVHIKTNLAFVKFTVNGKRNWENHSYADRHKTLIVMGLDRLEQNVVVLTPREEGFAPVTLTLTEADFKRRRVRYEGRSVTVFYAGKTVKFSKDAAPAPPPKGSNAEPAKGSKPAPPDAKKPAKPAKKPTAARPGKKK